jgi:hypothetical protein
MRSDDEGHRDLLPEESSAGSDDPVVETAVILEESMERAEARPDDGESSSDTEPTEADGAPVEHRTSDETVEP